MKASETAFLKSVELRPYVPSVNPFDIEDRGAREVVRTNDFARWITRRVQDIRDLASQLGLRAG